MDENKCVQSDTKSVDDAKVDKEIFKIEDIIPNNESKTAPSRNRRKRPKPGFHLEMFKETSYYFQGGFRYVYPYSFTFTAYAKERWLGLSVLELFSKEFHMETMEYYKKAILDGKIKINGKPVSCDTVISNSQILQTMLHRHEPPVLNEAIEFLLNDKEMVVINKPPSIPVHPCGRYRHNTIVFILGKEYGLHGLHTIHRIDRLTSGVLMFAKTIAKAKEIENQIHKEGNVEKEYIARVDGEFPEEEIVVDKPIITASHKIGVCHVHDEGKTCSTKFKRLSFNGKSSVVSCKPHQGRMHQIRVHLQWLGHPIVNDPIYNHPTAWGERKRKYDIDTVIKELLRTRKDKSYDDELSTDKPDPNEAEVSSVDSISCIDKTSESNTIETNDVVNSNPKRRKIDESCEKNENCVNKDEDINNDKNESIQTDSNLTIENEEDKHSSQSFVNKDYDKNICFTSRDIGEEYVDEDCSDCKRIWKKPLLSEMVMYLHSLHYKGPNWGYKTSVPKWAEVDWDKD